MPGKAMDKLYKFDENGNLVEVLVPTGIGFIGLYAGPEPPEGYLYCDGSAIGRETYSELFEAVGTLYGAGDGAETFNLPDARGVFFRGDGGENNAAMGTQQGDAIREISGTLLDLVYQNVHDGKMPIIKSGCFRNADIQSNQAVTPTNATSLTGTDGIDFKASFVVPTANEVRPINLAMKPCIRYV